MPKTKADVMVCLYFIKQPQKDRWIKGDRFILSILRRIIKGKERPGGVEKVFINLCKGLDLLKIKYQVNLPFNKLLPEDKVAVLGAGSKCLEGYKMPNKIVAGIGLMTHPSEWPNLCKDYPIIKYLQHSKWAADVYKPYFGEEICDIWPVGVDTKHWKPNEAIAKDIDFLIYNKIRWDKEKVDETLRLPILEKLKALKLKTVELVYGQYDSNHFHQLLLRSKSMLFLVEHESQGIACCEAMSCDVPILAWENGFCLDPNRFKWGDAVIPATSVPIFNPEQCGSVFKDFEKFEEVLPEFLSKVQQRFFHPRNFVEENISLEKSAQHFLNILNIVD